jgi:hypothetical protein
MLVVQRALVSFLPLRHCGNFSFAILDSIQRFLSNIHIQQAYGVSYEPD